MRAWLFRVAYNEAMAIRRRQGVENRSLARLARSSPKFPETPEEAAIGSEWKEQIQQAMTRLPEEQRDVVRRRIYDEMTFAEIAETLGVPLGTVLTRMRLALKKLRKALTE
mgnify:CR=1 FL=1